MDEGHYVVIDNWRKGNVAGIFHNKTTADECKQALTILIAVSIELYYEGSYGEAGQRFERERYDFFKNEASKRFNVYEVCE